MTTTYLEPQSPLAQSIQQLTHYTGKRYRLSTVPPNTPMSYHAYWDGGSRTTYTFVNLDTWTTAPLPEGANNPFNAVAHGTYTLPWNVGVLEHHIVRGQDMGLELRVRDDNATQMLPETPDTLTAHERIVLEYTASLKSSYGGIKNFRWSEANRRTGITLPAWNTAKTALIASGHLNKAGAITIKGRNART